MDTGKRKLSAARLWAATRFPYLASALFASRLTLVPGIQTIAVDERWNLYVDPALAEEMTVSQLGSVLVHHSGHLLRDHAARARAAGITKQTAESWMTAADAEINDDLPAETLDFPTEPVTPTALGLESGRFAEEYFASIKQDEQECQDCGSGSDDLGREWDSQEGGIGRKSAHLLRCQVAAEILRESRRDGVGTIPLGLQRWAEGILKSKVDWRRALSAEIRSGLAAVAGKVDYTYQRPSRRQSISREVLLPSLHRPVPEVAVVIDTSGSMSERTLGAALAEVEGLLRHLGVQKRLSILSCDAAVQKVQRVSSASQVELFGGGGTNMGMGLDAAQALKPTPSVVVVLTDGMTPWPPNPPKGIRVVVALLEANTMPSPSWARTVVVDEVA